MFLEYIKYLNKTYSRFTKNRIYKIEDDDINFYIISDKGFKITVSSDFMRGYLAPNWCKSDKCEYENQIRKDKLKNINKNIK